MLADTKWTMTFLDWVRLTSRPVARAIASAPRRKEKARRAKPRSGRDPLRLRRSNRAGREETASARRSGELSQVKRRPGYWEDGARPRRSRRRSPALGGTCCRSNRLRDD